MRARRNWIAIVGGLALLTFVLRATPARLSVSNREAAIEGAAPGTRLTLFDGATPIGDVVADSSGRARFGELHLSPGDHVLRVTDWGTGWGVGDPVHMSVDAPRAKGTTATTIALSSSANPSFFGLPLTLRALVTPSTATGAVTFYDGTTVLGMTTLTGGVASLTTIMPAFGTRPFKAYYAGSPAYAPSTSPLLQQTVIVPSQNGFQSAANFLSNHASAIAVGDFNGDGFPDLAVVNNSPASTVAISLAIPSAPATSGRSQGIGFQPPVEYPTGTSSNFVAAGDFNGDGKLDLAVANAGSSNVSVLLGNGDGTFQNKVDYPAGTNPVGLTLADFDGDGNVDLAVADLSNSVSLLLGKGDGTFSASGTFPSGGAPSTAQSIASADFNGDGNADLAISNTFGKVTILLGNGAGSFQSPVEYDIVNGLSLTVADVNGDGKMDLVVPTGLSVCVLPGRGDGTFQPAVQYNVGLGAFFVAVGDFNGDGIADLAVTNAPPDEIRLTPAVDTVTILLGTPHGAFTPQGTYALPGEPRVMAVGDFNRDARSDLAVVDSDSGFSVLLGIPAYLGSGVTLSDSPNPTILSGSVTLTAHVTPPSAPGSVTFYDGAAVLGTGTVGLGVATFTTTVLPSGARQLRAHYSGDPVYAGSDSPSVAHTVIAIPEDGLQAPQIVDGGLQLAAMASGDFNGDGIPDLAVADNASNQVRILIGQGDGTFRTAVEYDGGHQPVSLAVGDFNGDGKQDLAVIATQQPATGNGVDQFGLNILFGNGDGTFQPSVGYDTGSGPSFVVAADFNGDGKTDLAVSNKADGTVSVMLGNGDGTFRSMLYQSGVPPSFLDKQTLPITLAVGDFNNDGIPDLIVVGRFAQVSLGNGDGTFRTSYVPDTGAVYSVAVGDLNGDGKPDFVVNGSDPILGSHLVFTVCLGNGDGTFASMSGPIPEAIFNAMAVGDFNGDGIPDLVFVENDAKAGIFTGNGDGTFQPAITYKLVSQPIALVVGDFNRDGRSDLAVATRLHNAVTIFLGKPAAPTEVTLQTSPPGRAISVDGIPVTTPVTLTLAQGPHTIAAPSPQADAAGERFVFGRWNDGGAASHSITVLAAPTTYTAVFGEQFLLTTSVQPAGTGLLSVNPPSPAPDGYYNFGTKVTVTAAPAVGSSFSGFSGALTGIVNPQVLSMTAPATVSASFIAIPPVSTPTIFGAIANKTTQGSTTTLTLVLSNTGTGPAQSVSLTSLTAGVLTGTGSVSVAAPVIPYSAGALGTGAEANIPVQLTLTGTVSRVRLLFGGTMQNTAGAPLMFSGAAQVLIP